MGYAFEHTQDSVATGTSAADASRITDADRQIAAFRDLVELGEEEAKALQRDADEFIPSATEFEDSLNGNLLSIGETRAYFAAPDSLDPARHGQRRHFRRLFFGEYGPDCAPGQRTKAHPHFQIGIEPGWLLGEYARYVDYLVEVASGAFEDDPVRALEIVQAGVKLAFHDAHKEIDELMRVLLERHKALLEAQELINARNRELARLNNARDRFLGAVIHELRTPLTSLLVFADVLLKNRSNTLSPRDMQQLHAVQRNGRRLETLIRDLIDVSSARSGTFKLLYAQFDARAMLEEFQQSFAPVLAERQQRLQLSCEDGNMAVVADRDRLVQVMSNLGSKACKFSPVGSTVTVRSAVTAGRLCVSVADQGAGIPPEEQPRLFQPFYRADHEASRRSPGTGLGLYVCKTIVEQHSGRIAVQSEPGKGTTVSWSVPVRPDAGLIDGPHVSAAATAEGT